jgi:uncharacterized protein (DUF1499 family)
MLSIFPVSIVVAEINMNCSDSPNCVSSQSQDSNHYIEPFAFSDTSVDAMARLKSALMNEKRVTIIEETDNKLRAEVRSLFFRFVDDVEFSLLAEDKLIHCRSQSRTGYYDFGVNRRRLERIRKLFQK